MNLSTSALGILKNCHKCFYFDRKLKISRPRGIVPSLPNGMDAKLKAYFDVWRLKTVNPPELSDPRLAGFRLLNDPEKLKAWRQWNAKAALKVETPKWKLVGGFDDCLYSPEGDTYAPLDIKTTSSAERGQEEAEKYYQTQIDILTLLLEHNGYKPAGFGVLLSYSPAVCLNDELCGLIRFNVQTIIIQADAKRATAICNQAIAFLESDLMPPSGPECEYCKFLSQRAPHEKAFETV